MDILQGLTVVLAFCFVRLVSSYVDASEIGHLLKVRFITHLNHTMWRHRRM